MPAAIRNGRGSMRKVYRICINLPQCLNVNYCLLACYKIEVRRVSAKSVNLPHLVLCRRYITCLQTMICPNIWSQALFPFEGNGQPEPQTNAFSSQDIPGIGLSYSMASLWNPSYTTIVNIHLLASGTLDPLICVLNLQKRCMSSQMCSHCQSFA